MQNITLHELLILMANGTQDEIMETVDLFQESMLSIDGNEVADFEEED